MKMVNKIGIFISAMMLVTSACFAQTADVKIGTVNVQQVLQQSPRVVNLSKKLEADFKDRQSKISTQQAALQEQMEKFKKEAPTMSQKDRDALQTKITKERSDLVKQVVAYQQDLQKEQGKIMQGVLADLNSVVSSIAKAQNLPLVMDSQAVIYTANGTDITKEVSKEFNDKK